MKMPIEWRLGLAESQIKAFILAHKEELIEIAKGYGLAGSEDFLAKARELYDQKAKRQGKDGFDAEKFLKKRGK